MKKVYTSLPASRVNVAIMNSVIGQMSDGIWENSPRMDRIWRGLDFTTEDGKIVITVDYPSELHYKTESEIAEYMANKIKQVIKIEIDDGLRAEWDRNSRVVSNYLSRWEQPVEIRDAYQAYDILKSRKIKQKVPEQIDARDLTVGMDIEGYGRISFLQEIDIEGKKYYVVKAGYGDPKLISGEAILRRRVD